MELYKFIRNKEITKNTWWKRILQWLRISWNYTSTGNRLVIREGNKFRNIYLLW